GAGVRGRCRDAQAVGADDRRRSFSQPDIDLVYDARGLPVSGSFPPVGDTTAARAPGGGGMKLLEHMSRKGHIQRMDNFLFAPGAAFATRLAKVAAASMLLALSACTVGPDYQRPPIDVGDG